MVIKCPKCGAFRPVAAEVCPRCTVETDLLYAPPTQQLDRVPTTFPLAPGKQQVFVPASPVLLQFIPSGLCMMLTLNRPVILGRSSETDASPLDPVIDLTHMGAARRGVSRQHCLLEPQGEQLLITDLYSTNGTYLNGERLLPQIPHRLSEGDRVILGTLHLTVFFGDTHQNKLL